MSTWRCLTCRIQGVNINTQIHGLRGSDSIPDLPDDPVHADGVYLPGLDDLETAVAVILIVRWPGESGSDPGMYIRIVRQETFLARMIEIGTVIDTGLLGRCTPEDLGLPRITVLGLARPPTDQNKG